MKASVFLKKIKDIEQNYKTMYAWGCFGCPLKASVIAEKANQYSDWYTPSVIAALKKAGNRGAFGFDCVNLIKGVLWGWSGKANEKWGGAEYNSNGVLDLTADGFFDICKEFSNDFESTELLPGEAVWVTGHIGVYIGDGMVIECTPAWSGDVQKTICKNINHAEGKGRKWTAHGKIPYIQYDIKPEKKQIVTKNINQIVSEVIQGKWGNGVERERRLSKAGYNYATIQHKVNIRFVAKEVIQGKWGNGQERKNKLTKAGHSYSEVQTEVNRILKNK